MKLSPRPGYVAFRSLPWVAKAVVIALGLAAASLAFLLWPAWLHDDNLTHGFFLPALVLVLFVESRRDPEPCFFRPGTWPLATGIFLLVASLASFMLALVYAVALGMDHALVEFLLAGTFVLTLAAAWIGLADERVRFLPFNWMAGVATGLGIFASPPPPGTYARLAMVLQEQVSSGVVWTLNTIGIAAWRDGNVIELARTSVGVTEACSGVRSLISCVAAGLFLSALLVRRPWHRALVIVLSPAIGLVMNFSRSLFLTLLANTGVNIEGRWHDLTGASVLVCTTILVLAFALWLRRRERAIAVQSEKVDAFDGGNERHRLSPLPGIVVAVLVFAAGVGGVLAFSASSARGTDIGHAPDLAAFFPSAPDGWNAQTTSGMDRYSGVLRTHDLVERVYSSGDTSVAFYLAYWRPGQAPVSLVDAHTPDACWPGTGWEARSVPQQRESLGIDGRTLAPAECRLFVHGQAATRVWYWHLYGGRPLTVVDPYSAVRLLKLSWRYGFDRPQDQLFIRVSSNRSWDEIRALAVVRRFLRI